METHSLDNVIQLQYLTSQQPVNKIELLPFQMKVSPSEVIGTLTSGILISSEEVPNPENYSMYGELDLRSRRSLLVPEALMAFMRGTFGKGKEHTIFTPGFAISTVERFQRARGSWLNITLIGNENIIPILALGLLGRDSSINYKPIVPNPNDKNIYSLQLDSSELENIAIMRGAVFFAQREHIEQDKIKQIPDAFLRLLAEDISSELTHFTLVEEEQRKLHVLKDLAETVRDVGTFFSCFSLIKQ